MFGYVVPKIDFELFDLWFVC